MPIKFKVIQIAMIYWLMGWYLKSYFYFPYMFYYIHKYPVRYDLFPPFFTNPYLSEITFLLPALCLPFIFLPSMKRFKGISALFLICSIISAVHINTYNDATFVTSFWVALWLCWFSFNIHRNNVSLRLHATVLAQCIIGMIFLGGFLGKLTPHYLSGEAIFYIFMKWPDHWPHTWIVNAFSIEQQKIIALYFSRSIIVVEFLLALSPVFPSRLILRIAPVVMAMFTLTNSYNILSVVGCLIGMCLACLFWEKKATAEAIY